jgi:hypothetical protein
VRKIQRLLDRVLWILMLFLHRLLLSLVFELSPVGSVINQPTAQTSLDTQRPKRTHMEALYTPAPRFKVGNDDKGWGRRQCVQ